ncbi:MAG: anti-sigma factor family protein, partial [Solirubrobacterales bacterium]
TQATDEMTCKEFVELVTDLIEGQLAEAQRVEAEAHLGECEGCTAYVDQIRQTIAGLRALAESDDFPATRERATAAFRELKGTD